MFPRIISALYGGKKGGKKLIYKRDYISVCYRAVVRAAYLLCSSHDAPCCLTNCLTEIKSPHLVEVDRPASQAYYISQGENSISNLEIKMHLHFPPHSAAVGTVSDPSQV